jgi:hypothetical protein
MWVRARQAITRWTTPPPPAPPLTPADRARQQAVRAMQDAERAWAARLERIAEERRQAYAAREAAEQAALAAEVERRRLAREELLELCARNHGWYFPGDRLSGPSESLGRWRRDGLMGRVLTMLGFGG